MKMFKIFLVILILKELEGTDTTRLLKYDENCNDDNQCDESLNLSCNGVTCDCQYKGYF